MQSWIQSPLRSFRQQPWPLTSAIAARLDPSVPIQEERSPFYSSDYFYPARLGEVLHGRYQLATKLGHGSRSTVWLARDLFHSSDPTRKAANDAEAQLLRRVATTNPRHKGWSFVQRILDDFCIEGSSGSHVCIVTSPLREALSMNRKRYVNGAVAVEIVKIMVQMLLQALDYIHSECHIIHTDLKPDNIMLKLEDKLLLHQDALDEFEHPKPQKHLDNGRIIYPSRGIYGHPKRILGTLEIIDFDLSVSGDGPHDGCIQAEVYRAPEVILDAGYSYAADIWSLGVLLWDVVEGRPLFEAVDPHVVNEYEDKDHLALITSILGPPPKEILEKGKRTSLFYNSEGNLNNLDSPPSLSFESSLSILQGEEKRRFIEFAKRMIKWRPEERSTAKELLDDQWLYTDF